MRLPNHPLCMTLAQGKKFLLYAPCLRLSKIEQSQEETDMTCTYTSLIERSALLAPLILGLCTTPVCQATSRPRIRDLGVRPGILSPGPLNAITDVDGVRVGHQTLVRGDSVRTGVTAVLPHDGNLFQEKVPAAVYVGNGFGKAAGFLQVQELGLLESPIILTNTLSVGTAVTAVVEWSLRQPGNETIQSVNAVVGETNDGTLNDIRALSVLVEDVQAAIEAATGGSILEGNVGAGTGTRAMGWKAGIGTSSRALPQNLGGFTVGALVQSNFGGTLRIDGVRVGEKLGVHPFANELSARSRVSPESGSIMIVLATDAPLGSRNLERLARRAVLALGRVGSFMSNGSGDFIIAFSTTGSVPYTDKESEYLARRLRNDRMSPFFLAAVEAVEEAIYNSLLQAESMSGYRGNTIEALPILEVKEILSAAGVLDTVDQ